MNELRLRIYEQIINDSPGVKTSLFNKICGVTIFISIFFAVIITENSIDSKFGDQGAFKTIKKGSIYIDNTTASATIAREIYEYAKKNGFGALDAPVSGGQAGAENGALTVMIGGDQADFDKAKDKIDCYSRHETKNGTKKGRYWTTN